MKPETVNVTEAKAQLSSLLARIEKGEEFIIARGDKPVAKLSKIEVAKKKNRTEGFEGTVLWVAEDWQEWPEGFWDFLDEPLA